MPAGRKPCITTQKIRETIRTAELIELLQKNSFARGGRPINPGKFNQIKLLLSKSLPDLRATEHTGNVESSITISWEGETPKK